MECPYCKMEMIPGYIAGSGRRPITWHEDSEKSLSLVNRITNVRRVLGSGSFTLAKVKGYQCTGCKKIILDYHW